MDYFDVLYGQIQLDPIVEEILDRCWEVRRLKHVGMMNFRSLSMLPLTQSSRLEHAIGTGYLAQRFSAANGLDRLQRRTFVAAALLHDISCSPFGHSVEWALMASGKLDSHEAASLWTLTSKLSAATSGRPAFLDSLPFEPTAFDLDPVLFQAFQLGTPGHTHIKSDHMDLDNIDSVFRMAYYLGMEQTAKEHVFRLVDSLRMTPSGTYFSILEEAVPKADLWHRLRHDVYLSFIYNDAYMSFEAQIFELIDNLAASLDDPKEIAGLADYPDDVLLWQYFIDDKFATVRPLLRRLIALDTYRCLYIGRVESPEICKALPSEQHILRFKTAFVRTTLQHRGEPGWGIHAEGPVGRWVRSLRLKEATFPGPIHVHITTDKRKTERRVAVAVVGSDGSARPLVVGEDRFYVVGALMTEVELTQKESAFVTQCFVEALREWGGSEVVPMGSGHPVPDSQLSLEM